MLEDKPVGENDICKHIGYCQHVTNNCYGGVVLKVENSRQIGCDEYPDFSKEAPQKASV